MARVTCAISGLHFTTEYLANLHLPHTVGYFHPIFACTTKQLYQIYNAHCKGLLTPKDSYLLFLAFLHSTEQIQWKAPSSLDPNSAVCYRLIENNLSQLLEVIAKTDVIKHPSFSQPSFVVTYDNSNLIQIPSWIKAWKANIVYFHSGRADLKTMETLQKVENKLTKLILSGEKPERYAHIIADWACKAAEFPEDKEELYKVTIRSCFNITKMFNTPLSLLKEIKDYCECNIEAGSIHFHSLLQVIKQGISKHVDYLGGSTLALGYTLLPVAAEAAERKNQAELASIKANAPANYPKREDYSNTLDFIKAKLAYNVSYRILETEDSKTETNKEKEQEDE